MGFLDAKDKWRCQDPCLSKNQNGQLCGITDHFTNFALLLSGANGKGSDPCASSQPTDIVLPYLSLALVSLAIIIVILSVIVIEVRVRYIAMRKKKNGNQVTIEYAE